MQLSLSAAVAVVDKFIRLLMGLESNLSREHFATFFDMWGKSSTRLLMLSTNVQTTTMTRSDTPILIT